MREVARGVAVGHRLDAGVARAQRRDTACLLLASAVGCRQEADQALAAAAPAHPGTDDFPESEGVRDGGHVEIGARAEENEMVAGTRMGLDGLDRLRENAGCQ